MPRTFCLPTLRSAPLVCSAVQQLVLLLCCCVSSLGVLQAQQPETVPAVSHWNFENDIVPILSRFGCNTSGCHGKAEGQNGFKLSVFGSDPEADYDAVVKENFGRRVFPAVPENSLLLLKATGQVPHGGGSRLTAEHPQYVRLYNWIAAGMPQGSSADARLIRIEVRPRELQMGQEQSVQLRATAFWSDGRSEDVTGLATWQTNSEAVASVDDFGRVLTGRVPGTVAVMASFLGRVDVFQALVPHPGQPNADSLSRLARLSQSPVSYDRIVAARLEQLRIAPAVPCDDATFLRRVSLDLIGTLPTAQQAREFLSDGASDRREKLVDRLLQQPEFADYWTLKWADLLRVNRRTLGRKGAAAYYSWIHECVASNLPLDRFVAQLLTAEGPLTASPAGYFYKAITDPNDLANTVSQVFLGVRIECARCHHHPWDRWSQTDYHGMQAFFTQVSFRKTGDTESLVASAKTATVHPRTKQVVQAHALDQRQPEQVPEGDRRRLLANWLAASDNPWFARNLANRTWAHFLGRGLVEPADDFRLTNPAANPELLDELARQLTELQFDYRRFVRTIVLSQTYQLGTEISDSNATDEQNYSRYPLKRLDAEVLLDAVSQATGVPEEFPGMPAGTRAIQLWDSHLPHQFLELFGRPVRETACECERVTEPTVSQVLHVLNSPQIESRLRHADGRIARLCEQESDDRKLVEDLFLTFCSRLPTADEQQAAQQHLSVAPSRREGAEDLAWGLLNSLEFLVNH